MDRDHVEKAVLDLKRAAELLPDDVPNLVNLGGALVRLKNPGEALEYLNEASKQYQRRQRAIPAHVPMVLHYNRGAAFAALGQVKEALSDQERAAELGYSNPAFFNQMAWVRATSEDADVRDPDKAVQFARKAVALARDHAPFQTTLGVALYRAGEWHKALSAFRDSMNLTKKEGACEAYFIAMSAAQLKKNAAALKWYEKGVALHGAESSNEELNRFRAEAEQVLGIKGKDE